MISIEEILTSARDALLGEVYPAIRQVVLKYDSLQKLILLRYYLDREPRECDYESISLVMTELISHFNIGEHFKIVKEECIYSKEPFNKLDSLDEIVYARREHNMDEVT